MATTRTSLSQPLESSHSATTAEGTATTESSSSVDLLALQAQLQVSIGLARSVVSSWIPPLTPEEQLLEQQQQKTPIDKNTKPNNSSLNGQLTENDVFKDGVIGRPSRLGLGAPFLPHSVAVSAPESALRRLVGLTGNRRGLDGRKGDLARGGGGGGCGGTRDANLKKSWEESRNSKKRKKDGSASHYNRTNLDYNDYDEDDEEEEEEEEEEFGRIRSFKDSKTSETFGKKIKASGDFLSSYLGERDGRKKKKKKTKTQQTNNAEAAR